MAKTKDTPREISDAMRRLVDAVGQTKTRSIDVAHANGYQTKAEYAEEMNLSLGQAGSVLREALRDGRVERIMVKHGQTQVSCWRAK